MTTQKSFKKLTRARMAKTGESYTTARRQLLRALPESSGPSIPAPSPGSGVRSMRETKGSEENVRKNTGRGFDEWFAILDAWDATTKGHTAIARWLSAEHGVENWWAQGVTIAYEQERGLRAPGQTSGGFTAGGTKTVNVPAESLFSAFADDAMRARWLGETALSVRVARSPTSFRADWLTDRGTQSRLIVVIDELAPAKSRAAISHERLADSDEIAELKPFWKERLADLKKLLEGG